MNITKKEAQRRAWSEGFLDGYYEEDRAVPYHKGGRCWHAWFAGQSHGRVQLAWERLEDEELRKNGQYVIRPIIRLPWKIKETA